MYDIVRLRRMWGEKVKRKKKEGGGDVGQSKGHDLELSSNVQLTPKYDTTTLKAVEVLLLLNTTIDTIYDTENISSNSKHVSKNSKN